MDAIDTIEYNGYTISTFYDESPESPREWDNLGRMALSHDRYNFPNDDGVNFDDFDSWQAAETYLRKEYGAVIVLPVQMYEHSGVSLYVGNMHDQWDGGQVGLIYATAADIRTCFNIKRITKKYREQVKITLENEVNTYSQYVSGEVYGFTITDPDGKEVDSCYGFYGNDGMVNEAKSVIDNVAARRAQRKVAKSAGEYHR